jgi:hypothetical protein
VKVVNTPQSPLFSTSPRTSSLFAYNDTVNTLNLPYTYDPTTAAPRLAHLIFVPNFFHTAVSRTRLSLFFRSPAMAESNAAAAPALSTNIESGKFDEKERPVESAPAKKTEEDDDEDEDIDALIEDLESQDGADAFEEEEETASPGTGRTVPEELLQTDSRIGLTSDEGMEAPLHVRACSAAVY